MIRDNRVFAVLTPQVYEVIESDTVAGEAQALAAQEPSLASEVSQRTGQPGSKRAASHHRAYVAAVRRAQRATYRISEWLLAQVPRRFSRNRVAGPGRGRHGNGRRWERVAHG